MSDLTPESPLLQERGHHEVNGVRWIATKLKTSEFGSAVVAGIGVTTSGDSRRNCPPQRRPGKAGGS